MKPVWLSLMAGVTLVVVSNCGGPTSETYVPMGGEFQTGPRNDAGLAADGSARGGGPGTGGNAAGGAAVPAGTGGTTGTGGTSGQAGQPATGGAPNTTGGAGGGPTNAGGTGGAITSTGGAAGTPMMGGAAGGTTVNNGDTAEWHFEESTQAWKGLRGIDQPKLATTTVRKGKQSLEFPVVITAAQVTAAGAATVERAVGIATPDIALVAGTPSWSGKTITFHVWVPANLPSGYFTAYVLGSNQPWKDSGNANLSRGAWNTINLVVPTITNAAQGFLELGLYFKGVNAPWSGSLFIDSVEVN